MKKLKQNFWQVSLSLIWLMIVFLISCKPSSDSKPSETTPQEPKDSLKTQAEPVKADTLKKDTTAQVVVPKKKKKKIINKPPVDQPNPVCKYGVRRDPNKIIEGNN